MMHCWCSVSSTVAPLMLFIERYDALLVFSQRYSGTIDALQTIAAELNDRKAVDKAHSFVTAMTDCTFIMSLCCVYKVMALTIVLSRSLQKVNQYRTLSL